MKLILAIWLTVIGMAAIGYWSYRTAKGRIYFSVPNYQKTQCGLVLILWLLFWILFGCWMIRASDVSVWFSPRGGCSTAIIAEVNAATNQILVMAYNFTSPSIGDALATAARRGVAVIELQDNVASHQATFQGPKLVAAGGRVFIDTKHKISHNKILIVDSKTVMTGSFNFSDNAENSNAENLLMIRDVELAAIYKLNWSNHLAHCIPYVQVLPSPKAKP